MSAALHVPNARPDRAATGLTNLPLTASRFTTAFPKGPAYGIEERTTWGAFADLFRRRRQGDKDGPNFIPATFKPEPDGHVRRLKENILARTAIALDCETNKETGEVPPAFAEAVGRVKAKGWAGVVYTSHSHTPEAPRYRVVLPLSAEIAPTLPAPEVIADLLGLAGVLDMSKIGASSLFYLPSCAPGQLDRHQAVVIDGAPIATAWIQERAGALLAAREAEQARQRAEAMEVAAKRREERIRQGFDPATSIIEAVRDRLDLAGELISHGYKPAGRDRYLFAESSTGVPGVYILAGRDGVQRVYSHHAADPLAAGNLPTWCRAKAIDVVDVVAILDHGGDLKAALRTLAQRFGIETPRPAREEPPPHPEYDGCSDRQEDTAAEPPQPAQAAAPALRIINPADLELEPVPQREWIVQDWLPIGCTTANYGDGGVGKTLLAQQLMTACATVTPWCGQAVMPCRSLGLFCEDDEAELHRRQDRICQHLGIRLGSLGAMRWISGLGQDNTLATFTSDGRMHATERYDAIEKAAKDYGARLVVLDTAADLFAGNENDRGQVRRFIGLLNRLALEINGAVLLNAHPSRDGLKTGNLDGGSTAWNNSVRSRWSLARPGPDDDAKQQDTAERVLTRHKANYASTGDTIKLRWVLGAFAPMTTEGGISGTIQRAAVESVFLHLLDRCNEQQVRVSNSRNAGNYAPKVFAKRPDADGYSVKEFEKAMVRLFTDRRIRLAVYGRPGDARQHIIREPDSTEDAAP